MKLHPFAFFQTFSDTGEARFRNTRANGLQQIEQVYLIFEGPQFYEKKLIQQLKRKIHESVISDEFIYKYNYISTSTTDYRSVHSTLKSTDETIKHKFNQLR